VSEPVIVTSGLSKDYGSGRGLFDLGLEIRAGEVFGFLGPNGAGKSTTLRLLLDLIRPTAGSARVLGLDSRADSLEIRRRIGFLPADLALYPRLTGRAVLDHLAALRGGVDRRLRIVATLRGQRVGAGDPSGDVQHSRGPRRPGANRRNNSRTVAGYGRSPRGRCPLE